LNPNERITVLGQARPAAVLYAIAITEIIATERSGTESAIYGRESAIVTICASGMRDSSEDPSAEITVIAVRESAIAATEEWSGTNGTIIRPIATRIAGARRDSVMTVDELTAIIESRTSLNGLAPGPRLSTTPSS
jgi:hypothetical protein